MIGQYGSDLARAKQPGDRAGQEELAVSQSAAGIGAGFSGHRSDTAADSKSGEKDGEDDGEGVDSSAQQQGEQAGPDDFAAEGGEA